MTASVMGGSYLTIETIDEKADYLAVINRYGR
jgi:hypothetical protein